MFIIQIGFIVLFFTLLSLILLSKIHKEIRKENLAAFKNNQKLFFKDESAYVFIPDISIESGFSILEKKNDFGVTEYFFVGFEKLIPVHACKIIPNA